MSFSYLSFLRTRNASRISLCIGIILIGANLRAPITSVGPVLPFIQSSLDLNGLEAGILNALPLLIFALLSLATPSLAKRYGLEPTLGCALLAILVGTLIRSSNLIGSVWIGTFFLSLGIAVGNVLLPGLIKRDFKSEASTVISFYAATMAGIAGIATGLAKPIYDLSGSWRWSVGCWALLALIAFINWLPHWRVKAVEPASARVKQTTVSPWKHPLGWQVSLFFALHSFIFYSLIDWFASIASSRGEKLESAGMYLLVYQLVAIATNLGGATVIRRSNNQVLLGFTCGLLLLVGCLGLMLLPDASLLWLICAGLGAGIAMVASLSFFALRTHDHHQASALSGMAQFIGYLGAALGPLVFGALHDITGDWGIPLSLLCSCSALVMIFASLSGRNRLIG